MILWETDWASEIKKIKSKARDLILTLRSPVEKKNSMYIVFLKEVSCARINLLMYCNCQFNVWLLLPEGPKCKSTVGVGIHMNILTPGNTENERSKINCLKMNSQASHSSSDLIFTWSIWFCLFVYFWWVDFYSMYCFLSVCLSIASELVSFNTCVAGSHSCCRLPPYSLCSGLCQCVFWGNNYNKRHLKQQLLFLVSPVVFLPCSVMNLLPPRMTKIPCHHFALHVLFPSPLSQHMHVQLFLKASVNAFWQGRVEPKGTWLSSLTSL